MPKTSFVRNVASWLRRPRGIDDKVKFAEMPLGRRSQEATFLTKEVLGVGAFGKVVCVLNKHSGAEYALKTGMEVSRMSSRLICVLVLQHYKSVRATTCVTAD